MRALGLVAKFEKLDGTKPTRLIMIVRPVSIISPIISNPCGNSLDTPWLAAVGL